MLSSTFLLFWRRLNVRTRIMEMARKKITKNERPATKPADVKVNLEGARPKITRTKKVLFSAVTVLGFFALVELGLWMAGAPTLIEQEDPFRGFSGLVKVFQREGIPCNAEMEEYIAQRCAKYSPDGLRACFPRDIAEIICGTAIFEQRKPSLTREDIDRALNVYFGQ